MPSYGEETRYSRHALATMCGELEVDAFSDEELQPLLTAGYRTKGILEAADMNELEKLGFCQG